MVVENLKQYTISSYDELYEMYLNKEIGIIEQSMPTDLIRKSTKKDGYEIDLIKSLLDTDKSNFYHVEIIDNIFLITIIGFNITKSIGKDLKYSLNMGEDGIWEDMLDKNTFSNVNRNKEWIDAGKLGKLELRGEKVKLQHTTSKTINEKA